MSSGENGAGTRLPKYEHIGELGSGRKGEIKLMRNTRTQELVAVKYIARQVKLCCYPASRVATCGQGSYTSCRLLHKLKQHGCRLASVLV